MELSPVVCSQFDAALSMLKQAVERCPDALWDAPEDRNRFWQVAYHSLFFTHLYLQKSAADFRVWSKHRANSESIEPGPAYTQTEVLEYLHFCRQQVAERTADLDPEAPSGFDWCRFSKLELQFYNLRHLSQHTGELLERLGARAEMGVDWIMAGR